jgi:hypothetical protein
MKPPTDVVIEEREVHGDGGHGGLEGQCAELEMNRGGRR